jgi:hypothetical protein
MAVQEGKSPLLKTAYRAIVLKAITAADEIPVNIFAWPFLIMLWNLIARSDSVAGLMYHHYAWCEDSMVITFPKHKGDQEGQSASPKHVYANPFDPVICPILAHGVYLLCYPYRSDDVRPQIFLGTDSEKRFSRWLQSLIKKMTIEDIQNLQLGCSEKFLGTHSARKGASSFASAIPGGPSPINIFLRAGWSLGQVQHRYIFAGQGGDQFVGRTVVGLPLTEVEFSVLPPHFVNSEMCSQQLMQTVVSGFVGYPDGFRSCIPYFLASIVYHFEFLKTHLDPRHPLFKSRFVTHGLVDRLKAHVVTGLSTCPHTNMAATGIPPHLAITSAMEKMRTEIVELNSSLKRSYEEMRKYQVMNCRRKLLLGCLRMSK